MMLLRSASLCRHAAASSSALPTSSLSARSFATKPQKKPPPKPVDEKAKDAKKKASANWASKGTGTEGDKNIDFFVNLMLNQEARYAALKKVKRSQTRTLYEKLVARRYQTEMSRLQNRMDFALECKINIRDDAIAALPTEELRQEAMCITKGYAETPLNRRAATWTPPIPSKTE